MTEKKPPSDKSNLNEVMLALALDKEPPPGNKPTLVEIAAWQAGAYSGERAVQIKSHIARDPDCYRMWSDLIAAKRQLNAEHSPKKSAPKKCLKDWFTGRRLGFVGGGLAVALASVFVAVLGLRLVMDVDVLTSIDQDLQQWSGEAPSETSGWGKKLMSKGFDPLGIPTPLDTAKTAISVGIRSGLKQFLQRGVIPDSEEWQHIIETYVAKPKPCPEGESITSCQDQNALLKTLGQWTVLMAFDCQTPASQQAEGYWVLQQNRLDEFSQALPDYQGLEEIQKIIRQWPIPPTASPTDFCNQVETLKTFAAT